MSYNAKVNYDKARFIIIRMELVKSWNLCDTFKYSSTTSNLL